MDVAATIREKQSFWSKFQGRALTEQIAAIIALTEEIESSGQVTSEIVTQINFLFDREQQNLEPVQLVWLRSDSPSNDNVPDINRLRLIIDYTKIFNDYETCLHYIQETSATTTFFVSSTDQVTIDADIFKVTKNQENYLYCNEDENLQKYDWASKNPEWRKKMFGGDIDRLLFKMERDVEECMKKNKTIGLFQSLNEQTTEGYCSWWINFLDIVFHLPYTKTSLNQFIKTLETYYKGNNAALETLKEFEDNYSPKDAVKWYTKPSFIFVLMNNALRKRNIELIFLMGFFLQDLYRQLTEEYEKQLSGHFKRPILKLFRGQKMGHFELTNSLLHSMNEIIVLHSFFSTSFDRTVTLSFVDPTLNRKSAQQNVLFEIEIDLIRRPKSRPYADITHLSEIKHEKEVLFTPGVQFRISHISYDENINCWIVKMLLISNYDKNIMIINNPVETSKKLKYLFNALFYNRRLAISSDRVQIMFKYFNDLIESNDKTWLRALHLHVEGLIHPASAISNYRQALVIWSDFMKNDNNRHELNCFIDISRLHRDFAYYYERTDDFENRQRHLDQARDALKQALQHSTIDSEQILIQDELADLYSEQLLGSYKKNLSLVIKYKKLSLEHILNCYSASDEAIVPRLMELASLYESIAEYGVVLHYFQQVLEIHLQQTEPYYMHIITVCNKLAKLYIEHKRDAQSALLYQLISHQHILKQEKLKNELQLSDDNGFTTDGIVAASHVGLGNLYLKLKQYNLAIKNLTTAINLYEYYKRDDKDMKLGNIEEKLADIYQTLDQYSLAHQHLTNALELYEKRKRSIEEKHNLDIQNDEQDNSLRQAIDCTLYFRANVDELTKSIILIRKRLRKIGTLAEKQRQQSIH